jgi:hypothetical protein
MIPFYARRPVGILPLFLVATWAAGCASSGPPPAAPPSDESASPSLLLVDETGLTNRTLASGSGEILVPGVTFGGLYRHAGGSSDLVVSLHRGKNTQLGLLSLDGSFRLIHEMEGDVEYSTVRALDGDLAFGFEGDARGIGIHTTGGKTLDVGCSASSRALGWAGENRLVVADANNHYVVNVDGCATLRRVDSRKMHEEAFNPKSGTVAYILRELEYDREARQYVPDSSLWVADVDGANAKMIVSDRYKPHRPAWAPDGKELAFDAQLPDQPGKRLISVYDTEQESSAFLNPSSLDGPVNEWDPHWSPTGVNIAYTQRFGDTEPALLVRPMNGAFTALVGESGERFVRWIDDNHLVLSNGSVERVVSADGSFSAKAAPGAVILGLR